MNRRRGVAFFESFGHDIILTGRKLRRAAEKL
jgi:hypothetical protein